MSTLMPAESRRLYSWWWDSHNSPKNSKWLQENLTDMDLKVKAMIKLIEEDADSFARRAEMYYKKRPELMKFVEEFYRAYRALAERYNHATGALSHAHRTLAEAFPNHIAVQQSYESPSISPSTEVGPCTPEITSPLCLLFNPDDLQKNAVGGPGYFQCANRNAAYADDSSFATKKGLKQLDEMFAPQEEAPRVKLHEGKVRKGLNFQEEEESVSHSKILTGQPQILPEQGVNEKENAQNEIKRLQGEVFQLSIENKKLGIQIESVLTNSDLSRTEVQNLKDAITNMESEKQAIFLQGKLSRERISVLENEIFRAKHEFGKLYEEILMGIAKLCRAEEKYLLLEKANQSLILELEQGKMSLEEMRSLNQDHRIQEVKDKENAKNEMKRFHGQLSLVSNENRSLKIQLENETVHSQLSRAQVHNMRDALSKLESQKEAAALKSQLLLKCISNLETENFQAKGEIENFHVETLIGLYKLCIAEERYLELEKENQSLKLELDERKRLLEEIRKLSVESQKFLEQEVKEKENIKNEMEFLQSDISQLSIENQNLKSQVVSKSIHLGVYSTEVQNLRNAVSILECEKKDVVFENQFFRESIAILESEIYSAKEEIRKLHAEVLMGIVKLGSAEEQNIALKTANDNLKSRIETKIEHLKDLEISLKDSNKQQVETERSLQFWERQYNLSQEKVEHMTFEIQTHNNKLKDVENSKMRLEEEMDQIKDVNVKLKDCIFAYNSKLNHLQAEIVCLNAINCKLEDEINIHLEDNKVLQQELDCVINDKNDLDIKHKSLIEQLEVASLNMESLEILVRELQFGCAELSEGCQKLEDEKMLLLNKVKDVELICEKNEVLNNCLSNAMENIRSLEDACGSFNTKSSILIAEKAALASQITVVTGNMEKISEKNILLENSINDVNAELEGLLLKMKQLEESSQFFFDDNSNLLVQKNALVYQVESLQYHLTNLETKYGTLENDYLNMEKEKDISVAQFMELEIALEVQKKEHESLRQASKFKIVFLENQIHLLEEDRRFEEEELEVMQQKFMSYIIENLILHVCLSDMKDSFRTEKKQREFLIQSSEIQLSALECQIKILQEERHVRDEEFEEEQRNYMNSMLESFFLQKCLSEMKEKYFIFSQNYLQHVEASRCASLQISHLEDSKLHLVGKNTLLLEHNASLMDGIEILLESLDINKNLMHTDGNEDVFIQTIKGEINNRSAYISVLSSENQLLQYEISIYHIFLKQNSLEKVFLVQELGRMGDQLLVFQRDQDQLFERCEILRQDVNDEKQLNGSLKSEVESLCRLLSGLLEDFSNLREERNALEEENILITEEAATLEHLYLFFGSLNAERLQSLEAVGDELVSLVAIKNHHEQEILESKERVKVAENERKLLNKLLPLLEELRSQITLVEFDMFATRLFNEDIIHQVETGENLLRKKSMELLKAYKKIQCTQEEVTELWTKLDAANKEADEAKIFRVKFEDEVAVLLEGYVCKDLDIFFTYEENRILNEELNKLNGQVEVLRKSEHDLSSELQNKMSKLDRCDREILNLFNDVQISVVNNAVLEEKIFECAISFEVLEVCTLLQRGMLNERITQTNAHAFELMSKINDFENENRELKAIWSSCLPLFISLDNGIATVEKQAHQLANNLHEGQDNSSADPCEENINETRTSDIATVAGTLKLQNLVSKVKALEKLLADTSKQLKHERLLYASNLETSRRELEGLNTEIGDQDETQGNGTSRTKHGQLIKDIELDQVSNSNVVSRIQSAESEDQMLKLWETAEKDCNNSISNRQGIEHVEEIDIAFPSSELIAEKELGVDMLEMPTKGSQEDWNRRVVERLSIDSDKLFALKTTVKELEETILRSGKSGLGNCIELDAMQSKVKQAEKEILELIDTEEKLRKQVEEFSKPCNAERMRWLDRRQVFEQTRLIMDRIEKLETELQEIYFFFVNFDGEVARNKIRERDRSPRVLLRDYIDSWRVGKTRKRSLFCRCMRPKTEE